MFGEVFTQNAVALSGEHKTSMIDYKIVCEKQMLRAKRNTFSSMQIFGVKFPLPAIKDAVIAIFHVPRRKEVCLGNGFHRCLLIFYRIEKQRFTP